MDDLICPNCNQPIKVLATCKIDPATGRLRHAEKCGPELDGTRVSRQRDEDDIAEKIAAEDAAVTQKCRDASTEKEAAMTWQDKPDRAPTAPVDRIALLRRRHEAMD